MALTGPNFSSRTISNFKERLVGGGARSNLFEVSFGGENNSTLSGDLFNKLGFNGQLDESDLMLIKAAGLPASTIAEIPVPFRGRTLKIAGDRTFDIWTITVINDTDFKWRRLFERWMNYIVKVSDGSGSIEPASYMIDMNVTQLSRSPGVAPNVANNQKIDVLRKYVVKDVFPTNISQIDLSYNNENEIEEFTVDLQVQWWEAYNADGTDDII
jgi:hypothetical protein